MCPSSASSQSTNAERNNGPLAGHKERVRSVLRRLLLEEGIPPGHPLVVAYSALLERSTAQEEYKKLLLDSNTQMTEEQTKQYRISYFRGMDLVYGVPCRPASPIIDSAPSSPIHRQC